MSHVDNIARHYYRQMPTWIVIWIPSFVYSSREKKTANRLTWHQTLLFYCSKRRSARACQSIPTPPHHKLLPRYHIHFLAALVACQSNCIRESASLGASVYVETLLSIRRAGHTVATEDFGEFTWRARLYLL